MIPVNDAMTVQITGSLVVALLTLLACRWYWHRRADDAYQDGHAAGIHTQIGRQQRAQARLRPAGQHAMDAYRERAVPPRDGEPATDVIVADVTDAAHKRRAHEPAAVIPFPEGLPPGLCEYAARVMALAAPDTATAAAVARGEASLQRIITLTSPHAGGPR